jgi:hypothetical protein
VLDLADRKVEEGHALANLNDRLGANTAHGGAKTTVELEDSKLVEDGGVNVGEDLVGADLLGLGGLDALPVAGVLGIIWASPALMAVPHLHLLALGLLGQVAVVEEEERLHLVVEVLRSVSIVPR